MDGSNQGLFDIQGYNFVSQSRITGRGGGVGLYVNKDYSFNLRTDLCINQPFIECIFVELQLISMPNIVLGCVYRPPGTDLSLFNSSLLILLALLETGKSKSMTVLIIGDFNIDLIKAGNHGPSDDFANNLQMHSYLPTISVPTRLTEFSATLIDNIFLRATKLPIIKSAAVYSDISDHLPIVMQMQLPVKQPKHVIKPTLEYRVYDRDSMAGFNSNLQVPNLWKRTYDVLNNGGDSSAAMVTFQEIYFSVFDKHFPKKTKNHHCKLTPRQTWMTKGLVMSCLKKATLYKKYRQTNKLCDKNIYHSYDKKLKKLVRIAEKNYYSEKLKQFSGNSRKTWNLLNTVINKSAVTQDSMSFMINGSLCTDPSAIVEKLNEFFVNIGAVLSKSIKNATSSFDSCLSGNYPSSLAIDLSTPAEILKIVSEFKNKKSSGSDQIPMSIMKANVIGVAAPLSSIINHSLLTGCFPDCLKLAKVCPIFKSGDGSLIENYRPISVLSCFSKVFEKIMFNRLVSYLDRLNIINPNQYGFRKNHSAYMALLDLHDKITEAWDKNEFAIGISIDLSKAFDTINHHILLKKLAHYGVRGIVLEWFKSYLSDRKQYVCMGGVNSNLQDVTCGVPQGSVLGPLLFILYINDIVNCSHLLHFILFADDTNLFFSHHDLAYLYTSINAELSKLNDWFRANRLSLNIKKTNYVMFGTKRLFKDTSQFRLSIDGVIIDRVNSTKFLGVIVDSKLTWREHTVYVASKVARGIGALNRARRLLPRKLLLMLYHSMVYSHLSYCNIIWGSASAVHLHRLVMLQKRAVRIISDSHYQAHTSPIFAHLKLLKLADINIYQTLQFLYKLKYLLLPSSCMHLVQISVPRRVYPTRSHSFFTYPKCRTVHRERDISQRGPVIWNALPTTITNLSNIGVFHSSIQAYIFSKYII